MYNFIPIKYNGIEYPLDIECNIEEVAGNFDKKEINPNMEYSLHTEYSYGKRKFDADLVKKYGTIVSAKKENIPQLWESNEWAMEFADFIIELTDNKKPKIIEIHPPFNDYCSIELFLERYELFEKIIHKNYPKTIIVVENRTGTLYRGGKFILSETEEIVCLCKMIIEKKVNLGIVLDIPQILTAEKIDTLKFNKNVFRTLINKLLPYRELIKGIHLWAKKKSEAGKWVAHCGNFDTFFCNNENKNFFINEIKRLCDDSIPRFFVPEVNSGEQDLKLIVKEFF